MALSARDQVRLRIGDTDTTNPLFYDEELDQLLVDNDQVVLAAAADCCDILATRYAREYDFETDQQKFLRSQRSKAYKDMAKQLRDTLRVTTGVNPVVATRKDGYSQDIPADQASVASNAAGRVREGYYDPDLPY